MIDVTVKIPEDRVAEVYGVAGPWVAGEPVGGSPLAASPQDAHATTPASEWADREEDLALARIVWGKLSPRAVGLFSTLMAQPGKRISGEELAAALDIPNGKYGVAGV